MPQPLLKRSAIFGWLTLSLTCLTSTASADPAGGSVVHSGAYASGARSSASANGSLDSVIGAHPQQIKNSIQSQSKTYYITSGGDVLDESGHVLLSKTGQMVKISNTRNDRKSRIIQNDKQLEPILIGVMNAGLMKRRKFHFPVKDHTRQAVVHSSLGPDGVYIAPDVVSSSSSKTVITEDTAETISRNNGNLYGLAGNHFGLISATRATSLPNNSAILTVGSTNTLNTSGNTH